MKLNRPEMVLIDVDGTLVDSVPDLAWCVDAMMRELGMPERGEERVRHWVGNGVERLTKRALINQLDGEPDEELYARALPVFQDLYSENTSKRSCLYDGVEEALEFLKTTGVHIGCVQGQPVYVADFEGSWYC
jgi:phosphoglycolate phosphatase